MRLSKKYYIHLCDINFLDTILIQKASTMKKIIFNSLTVAFCLAALVSCKKDEITIEKK